jgi:hypothetical protein
MFKMEGQVYTFSSKIIFMFEKNLNPFKMEQHSQFKF